MGIKVWGCGAWVAAGGPIEAYEERSETVAVPEFMSTPDSYLLKIRGDSMIDAAICDGDFVVLRQQKNAEKGEIVAAQCVALARCSH